MAKEEIIRRAVEGVKRAKSHVADVEFSPEDAARTELDFLAEVVEAVIEAGATTVNIPYFNGHPRPMPVVLLRDKVSGMMTYFANFHNPAGVSQSLERRTEILRVAEEADLLVVEDNPYGLLGFEGDPTPAIRSLDEERVVYLGSFSKTFAPGFRVGALAPDGLIEAFEGKDPSWWVVGVQWHPENEGNISLDTQLIESFIQASADYRGGVRLAKVG